MPHPKCDSCRAENARLRCSKCQGLRETRVAVLPQAPLHGRPRAQAARRGRARLRAAVGDPTEDRRSRRRSVLRLCRRRRQPRARLRVQRCERGGRPRRPCLAEMAARNEWMVVDGVGPVRRWMFCAVCRLRFTDAADADMVRGWWRRVRDAPDSHEKRTALLNVARLLRDGDADDAADRLEEAAIRGRTRDDPRVLAVEMDRALGLVETNPAAALEMVTVLQPRVQRCVTAAARLSHATGLATALHQLDRAEEALPVSACTVLTSQPRSTDSSPSRLSTRWPCTHYVSSKSAASVRPKPCSPGTLP